MSFAVRTDGIYGCRAVAGPEEVQGHEEFSLIYVQLPTINLEAESERSWRDGALQAVAWLRERHRDQQDIGADTTLNPEQFTELLVYIQALRDWPQSSEFPDKEYRPLPPDWISGQVH